MSVESKNSNVKTRQDGDKKSTGLTSRMDAAPKELAGIGKVLAQRRLLRDTTNHPDIELSKTGRQGAIRRRLSKTAPEKSKATSSISDSGSPDDSGADSDSGGADFGSQS